MRSLELNKMNKSGKSVLSLVMAVILAVIGATIIFGTDGVLNTDFVANAPSWLQVLLPLAAGFALLYGIIGRK